MKTPYILPDPKGRKLVGVSRTTWSPLDKLGSPPQKIAIQGHNYRSHTESVGALDQFEEAPYVLPDFESLLEDNPGWLDEAVPPSEASRVVGRSENALGILRVRGGGPPYLKQGKCVHYLRRDLFDWLSAHRVRNTSEVPRRAK
jgi:hypothetical protein